MRKVVVIAPTYNEKGEIENLVNKVFNQSEKLLNWEIYLLIVDSHSKDGTIEVIKKLQKKFPNLHLLETEKEGLGKAYLKGFKYCEEKINPYLIIQIDADGQHDPDKIPEFIMKIEEGANFVIKFGFMKLKVTEWTNGYRAIKFWLVRNAYNHLENYSGYVFQVAFLDFAIKNNAVLGEIPIHFKERTTGISKINALQYSFQTFLYVFNNSSFIKYVIVGFAGFFVDFEISYIAIEKFHRPVWLGTILSGETAIICNFLLNNFWSFAHKRIKGGLTSFLWSFFKFNLVTSGSVLIQIGLLQLLIMLLGKQFWYIYKVFIIGFVIIPYSYILYNKVIWKNK